LVFREILVFKGYLARVFKAFKELLELKVLQVLACKVSKVILVFKASKEVVPRELPELKAL